MLENCLRWLETELWGFAGAGLPARHLSASIDRGSRVRAAFLSSAQGSNQSTKTNRRLEIPGSEERDLRRKS